jgi:hypothetical protein
MPTCRPDGFRTLHQARRAAWLRASHGKTVEPRHCDRCGRWHLHATTPPTTRTNTLTGD